MVKPQIAFLFAFMAFILGVSVTTLALLPRAQKAEARLEAIWTSIKDGAYPRPKTVPSIVCT